jgi:regulator of PEP synthase PpsR (kinase-PPPase family)
MPERQIVKGANGLFLDFFDAFLAPLESELGQMSSHALGRAHGMIDMAGYMTRIDATNFALANDDGGANREYDRADVVLIGVSRSRQDADLPVSGSAVRHLRSQLSA